MSYRVASASLSDVVERNIWEMVREELASCQERWYGPAALGHMVAGVGFQTGAKYFDRFENYLGATMVGSVIIAASLTAIALRARQYRQELRERQI